MNNLRSKIETERNDMETKLLKGTLNLIVDEIVSYDEVNNHLTEHGNINHHKIVKISKKEFDELQSILAANKYEYNDILKKLDITLDQIIFKSIDIEFEDGYKAHIEISDKDRVTAYIDAVLCNENGSEWSTDPSIDSKFDLAETDTEFDLTETFEFYSKSGNRYTVKIEAE